MMGPSASETRAGQSPEQDTATIVRHPAELGFETEEFTGKPVGKIRDGVRALITALKKILGEEQGETANAGEKIADATTAPAEDADGTRIQKTLELLTGGRFLSVEAMNKALKGLPGVNVEIPPEEIARLNGLLPGELPPEVLAKIKQIKDLTEGKKWLLVMQLPEVVIVDGIKRRFSLATVAEFMNRAAKADNSLMGLWLDERVPDAVKQGTWSSSPKVWSSACLEGSTQRRYEDQLLYQAKMLGAGPHIEADIILAIVLWYISSKENLVGSGYMNLNAQCSKGYQLFVGSDGDSFNLYGSGLSRTIANAGIGASFEIYSD